jgi:hypothetical protein
MVLMKSVTEHDARYVTYQEPNLYFQSHTHTHTTFHLTMMYYLTTIFGINVGPQQCFVQELVAM